MTAFAQSAADGFAPAANGVVNALAVQQDGKLLVGGAFTELAGSGTGSIARNKLGRLNPDGSLDATFDPGANNTVLALAVQSDGKILAGGDFTMLGGGGTGSTVRQHIARLNADGTLDTSFDPGVNGTVNVLVVQPDGKILVGGTFTTIGVSGRQNIGRLNADGSVDTSFNPGANNTVFAIAVQLDRRIVAGGDFTMLGGGGSGSTTRNRLGRINADGTLDTSFDPGANATVSAIALQPDGRIVVGGNFTMVGGGTGTTARARLARLSTTGTVEAFDPGANAAVFTVAVQPDGGILVGGLLTMLGGGGSGTTTRNYIGRLNTNGSLDSGFNPGASAVVNVVATLPDRKIVLAGGFVTLGGGGTGTVARVRIGRLMLDGTLDADFNPGADADIFAVALTPDGKIVVGGSFTMMGGGGTGAVARDRIARVLADGTLDAGFNPGADNAVLALAAQPDGKIIVGGNFTTLGGSTRNFLGRLNADGTLDTSFDPGANNTIFAVAVQPDGKILVAGSFTTLGGGGTGVTARNRMGRLNADGTVDLSFNPDVDNTVLTIVAQGDGKILIGGDFTALVGGTVTRNYVARLNTDGSPDSGFDPGANNEVVTLAVQGDGKILIGGLFSGVGGGTGASVRNYVARVDASGTVDAGFDPGADNAVLSLAVAADGGIFVGGRFTMLGGSTGTTARSSLGRLTSTGAVDSAFNPGANGDVWALGIQQDAKPFIGGSFTMLGGGGTGAAVRNYLGRLPNATAAVENLAVTSGGQIATWSRTLGAAEVTRVIFESSSNGITYTTLGNGARVTNGWQLTGLSLPLNQNFFIRARGDYGTGYVSGTLDAVRYTYLARPTISPTSLPAGGTGSPYSATFTTSGALGLVTFGATGTLPSGMTFSAGVLSGTPTQTGTFPLTVTATDDSSGCVASQNVTLSVVCPTITLSSTTFANGRVGVAYSPVTLTQTGGVGTTTFGVSAGALPGGLTLSSGGAVSGTPNAAGTFNFTVTATDANGCTGSRGYTLTVATAIPPTVTITSPTAAATFSTTAATIDLAGTASDDTAVTTVTWANDRGGSGTATGTTSWSITGIQLQLGANVLTVTASDGTLTTSATLTVTRNSAIAPTIAITSPTSAATFSTASATINLAGTASDDTAVTEVTWVNDRGGSGTATGTTAWSIAGIQLQTGSNVLTVTASDGTLTTSATLTVTRGLPTMAVDRGSLNFAAVSNGTSFTSKTGAQTVRLTQTGSGTVTWTAASNAPWLVVSPTSGSGSAALTVSVQFAGGLAASQTGAITLTLTGAGNTAGPVAVTLTVGSSAATLPFGVFDTPVGDATPLAGSIAVTGWALDNIGIQRLELWRDLQPGETTPPFASTPSDPRNGKVFISNATFVDNARPDVEALNPTMPFKYRAGWGYLLLTWGLWNQGNGTYNLYAFAFDQENNVATIGKKTIVVSNNAAAKPFGSIDTPGIGGEASGPNFGWALTPKVNGVATCKIQPSGVQVSIDSGPLQPAHYGDARSDIAGSFSGFSNSAEAGGNYLFDWSTLTTGTHTIGWYVTDDCNRADGVGSRFFQVSNGTNQIAAVTEAQSLVVAPDTESTEPITVARGFGELPLVVTPGEAGSRTVEVRHEERIEIRLPSGFDAAYQLGPGGEHRALPTGATWDATSGTLSWQPAAGFLGRYRIVFTGGGQRINVRIVVVP